MFSIELLKKSPDGIHRGYPEGTATILKQFKKKSKIQNEGNPREIR